MSDLVRGVRLARATATRAVAAGGSQNFLGASWVSTVLGRAPARMRRKVALRLVSLSPHYFYARDLEAEDARLRCSRAALVEQLVQPFLAAEMNVLDYGCGPGYLAAEVATQVRTVEAVDISRGVLACAQVLNPARNIDYETPDRAAARVDPIDVAYSFAVAQHLTDDVFGHVLGLLKQRLRPGGRLLVHFATPSDGWRSEGQWRTDTSLRGRTQLRYGLHCFGRSALDMTRATSKAGFHGIQIESLADKTTADDDIARQHWLVATA